jgi:hypothetical protein
MTKTPGGQLESYATRKSTRAKPMAAESAQPPRSAQEHVNRYAQLFADELQPILKIDGVTENTDLLGAYTEAVLRNLIRRGFQPMRVSRGGILDYPQKELNQQDVIVWAPYPAPAIFDVEGFGLVPRSSVFGVLEVKKSNYSSTDKELDDLLAGIDAQRAEALAQATPWNFPTKALGVIAALTKKPSSRLEKLLCNRRAVAIFDVRDGRREVRHRDVVVLINFLYELVWSYWGANSRAPAIGLIVEEGEQSRPAS